MLPDLFGSLIRMVDALPGDHDGVPGAASGRIGQCAALPLQRDNGVFRFLRDVIAVAFREVVPVREDRCLRQQEQKDQREAKSLLCAKCDAENAHFLSP